MTLKCALHFQVKIEQGDAAPDPPAAPHQETPEPPQLHQLPHLPMDVTEGEPQIPTNEETPPTEIDLVQEQPSSSTGIPNFLIEVHVSTKQS